jgi:hypothetical protein
MKKGVRYLQMLYEKGSQIPADALSKRESDTCRCFMKKGVRYLQMLNEKGSQIPADDL